MRTDSARFADRSRRRPPEAFVAWLWEHSLAGRRLRTTDGRRLQVVYPGRHALQWGPDFRGALLVIEGVVVRGDVEVHVRARDWNLHGHGRDPAYERTGLHVVFETPTAAPMMRSDGAALPTVALDTHLPGPVAELFARWESRTRAPLVATACLSPDEAADVLDRAGLARFQAKVDRFEADLTCVDSAQALWTGLLEALGYAANVRPFRRLAERVPIAEARWIGARGAEAAEALLMGESGLLPSQRGQLPMDQYGLHMEAVWASMRRSAPSPPLSWLLRGCRPNNAPVRRVAAAAALATADPPLEDAVLGALHELPPAPASRALRHLVAQAGPGYWQEHADFARPLGRPAALIGSARAADCVVNVLLPWAAAVERSMSRLGPSAAEAVYRVHPRLAENEITRHMRWQILGAASRARLTACRQQGLIAIYRGWCDARDCAACLAGPTSLPFPEPAIS